ncbi:unnamed protein product [Prorocentrum cordatum]|uniref:Uncharacterized protein n=1 Tax=Prorocentrum cordatum TaxID=2364126 RepID=A0ABN9RVR7_9DINO|nr:unnamed protein product [Polarella glacialis]
MSNLDPVTAAVTSQLKVLSTAVFSVLILQKQLSKRKWAALGQLVFGPPAPPFARGIGEVDLSLIKYADDLTKLHIAGGADIVLMDAGLSELAAANVYSNIALDEALAEGGWAQNKDKQTTILSLVGQGSEGLAGMEKYISIYFQTNKYSGWMAKLSDQPPADKKGRTGEASVQQRGVGSKPAKKQTIDELVIVLAKLVLSDEAELRALIGAVYDTWLVPVSAKVVEAALVENQAFNAEAQAEREKEKEAQKQNNTSFVKKKLCAPHLRVFAAVVEVAATKDGESYISLQRQAAVHYWTNTVTKVEQPEDLSDMVRFCRVKKLKAKAPDGTTDLAKVQFLLSSDQPNSHDLLMALRQTLKEQGGTKTIGGAPRGVLVREAQRLLDLVK